MNALYIGILTKGTTSRMRGDVLSNLLPLLEWQFIDTDQSFREAKRLWKSLAFRFKFGQLVNIINLDIVEKTKNKEYELIWVDKGVYLWKETIEHLRKRTNFLVHYTPDTAFFANQSRHFYKTADQYDLLVTTKSFELEKYKKIAHYDRIYLTTQAYDSNLHIPPKKIVSKKKDTVFIGLHERDREKCIETLLSSGIPVRLGGQGWSSFVKRHRSNDLLNYLGSHVFGDKYVQAYTSTMVGLGLLSKRFPELHTTRTFEIPAMGTLLATERNIDTCKFFNENEALFFSDYQELALKLNTLLNDKKRIENISFKGNHRVISGAYNYNSILSKILQKLSLLP